MSVDLFGRCLKRKYDGAGVSGRPGVGFKITESGDYDMEKHRLTNLGEPLCPTDSITLKYFEERLAKTLKDINEKIEKYNDVEMESMRDILLEIDDIITNLQMSDPVGYRERAQQIEESRTQVSDP